MAVWTITGHLQVKQRIHAKYGTAEFQKTQLDVLNALIILLIFGGSNFGCSACEHYGFTPPDCLDAPLVRLTHKAGAASRF